MAMTPPKRPTKNPKPIGAHPHAGQVEWAGKRPRRLSTPGPWPTPCRGADMPKGIPGSHPPCKVPGCPHKSRSRGLCHNHYALWRKHGDPTIKRSRTARWDGVTLEERFWAKVVRRGPDECWPWTGAQVGKGYGSFWDGSGHVVAHRVAYQLTKGPIPTGLLACHHCDNPPCCNPAHLFAGTKADNGLDMMAKGRGRGQFQQQTHCKAGHPLSGDNIYTYPDGSRACRTCMRRWGRDHDQRRTPRGRQRV